MFRSNCTLTYDHAACCLLLSFCRTADFSRLSKSFGTWSTKFRILHLFRCVFAVLPFRSAVDNTLQFFNSRSLLYCMPVFESRLVNSFASRRIPAWSGKSPSDAAIYAGIIDQDLDGIPAIKFQYHFCYPFGTCMISRGAWQSGQCAWCQQYDLICVVVFGPSRQGFCLPSVRRLY